MTKTYEWRGPRSKSKFTLKEQSRRVKTEEDLRRAHSVKLRFKVRPCRKYRAIEGSRAGYMTRAAW